MNRKFFCMVIFVFAAGFIPVEETAQNNSFKNRSGAENYDIGNKQLIFLGSVDGKSYFADVIWMGNWTAARDFCAASRMHLASITSAPQWDLLRSAYDYPTFTGNYWTSLRDAELPRQFSWDNLETGPSLEIGILWGNLNSRKFRTCGAFYVVDNYAGIYFAECTATLRAICET